MYQRNLLLSCFLCSICAVTLSCGLNSGDYLQSVSASPSTAQGSAHFVATGTYVNNNVVTPLPVLWFNVQPWTTNPTTQLYQLDEQGNATCYSTVSGTFFAYAVAPAKANGALTQLTRSTPQVVGVATITCP